MKFVTHKKPNPDHPGWSIDDDFHLNWLYTNQEPVWPHSCQGNTNRNICYPTDITEYQLQRKIDTVQVIAGVTSKLVTPPTELSIWFSISSQLNLSLNCLQSDAILAAKVVHYLTAPNPSKPECAVFLKVNLTQWVVESSSGAPAPSGTSDAINPSDASLLGQRSWKLQKHVGITTLGAARVRLGQHHIHEAALAPHCHHRLRVWWWSTSSSVIRIYLGLQTLGPGIIST